MHSNKKKESHEQLMKNAFGEDFWERPVEQRFDMLITRMMQTPPEQAKARSNARMKKRNDT